MSYQVVRSAQKDLIYVRWAILNKPAMIEKNMAICLFFGNSSPA
jgi:hypothetical protein